MRRVTFLAVLLSLLAPPALADTIILKSGRRISATNVVEEGDRVYYETTAGRLSFPKSMVDRIERGGYTDVGTGRSAEPPVEAPRPNLGADYDEVMQATLSGGSINRDYLTKLEEESRSGRREGVARVAMAYHAAAQWLLHHGEIGRALEHYRRGLIFAPEDLLLLGGIAQVHLNRTEFTEALEYLERARRIAPDSADVAKLMGWAYHGQNKFEQAIKEWKRAYQLRPDFDVLLALQKTQRDAEEESAYKEGESRHFLLRYHGEAAPQLAREVLRTLEGHFRDLESDLNYTPPEAIGVVLYTDEAYFDITGSPSWAGAINDGRIRVPVQGLTSMTPLLAHTLKHELVHSFLAQKTRGRCPTWLHEGLAQWFEGKRADPDLAAWLIVNATNQRLPSLALMDGSWLDLPPQTVRSFYISSLLVVEYVVQRYGMGDMERLLSRLPEEPSTEAALKGVLRMDYSELEVETQKYLYRTYLRHQSDKHDYRVGYSVASKPASSAARSGNFAINTHSLGLCAPSPTAPSPSSVGTPNAAVKFPSDPPPVEDSPSGIPIARDSVCACRKSLTTPAVRSIGGRLIPPRTSMRAPRRMGRSAGNFASSLR